MNALAQTVPQELAPGTPCLPCLKKGHTCYAHRYVDGEPQCIYCVDAEPCFFVLRKKTLPQIVVSPVTKPVQQSHILLLADRLKASGLAEVDIYAALLGQGYKRAQIKRALECEPALKSSIAPKEKPMQTAVRSNGHDTTTPPMKICGRPGCGKKLTAANKSGFCTKHFYDSKRTATTKTNAAKKTNGHAAAAPATESIPEPRVSLEVNAEQLDRFLVGLPLSDKHTLANAWLKGLI